MDADTRVAAFLSGGLDSSSVVASMALQSTSPVSTFSAGFEEASFNELGYASAVATKYNTDHHELVISQCTPELLPKLVRHFGEPFADSSAVPTFLISQLAAQHVRVVLSGDGGDEMFAGYETFAEAQRMQAFDRIPLSLRRAMSAIAEAMPSGWYGRTYLRVASRRSAVDRYLEHIHVPYFLCKDTLSARWLLPGEEGMYTRELNEFLIPGEADVLSQALYFAATSALVSDMLVKVDRMSMAHGLEVRSPYLDHELVEMAMAIPNNWKLREGRGKDIIYRAWGDRFPEVLFHRPKMGFAAPVPVWFRTSMRDVLYDVLTGPRFLSRGIVSPTFMRRLIVEHDKLHRDHSSWLWALLMLELWFESLEGVHEGQGLCRLN